MNKQFKLGDKVELLANHSEETASGKITCLKGTIAFVCDDSHEGCVFVNALDDKQNEQMFCLDFDEIELVK